MTNDDLAGLLRQDLRLMVRSDGPENDLTRAIKKLEAQLRENTAATDDLFAQRASMMAQVDELRAHLRALTWEEKGFGVDQEA